MPNDNKQKLPKNYTLKSEAASDVIKNIGVTSITSDANKNWGLASDVIKNIGVTSITSDANKNWGLASDVIKNIGVTSITSDANKNWGLASDVIKNIGVASITSDANKNWGLASDVIKNIGVTSITSDANKNWGLASDVIKNIGVASITSDANKNWGLASDVIKNIGVTSITSDANKNWGLASDVIKNIGVTSITSDVSIFKNLIVPNETVVRAFPYLQVNKQDVKNILSGISPSKYTIESDLKEEEDKFDSFLVLNSTNEKISLKSMVSTVSSIDLLNNITKDEVLLFYNHLASYPMLGLEHEVGRKIFHEINNIKVRTIQNKILYRARLRDINEREIPYSSEEMLSAPYGVSGLGRYNYLGHGELYTCDNKDVAIKECSKGGNIIVDLMKLELKRSVDLIDLTDKNNSLVQYCSFSANTASGLEYLVPTFIAQCAKMKGITGVIFNSTQDDNALNYVFFDYLKGWFNLKVMGDIGVR
ncbi:RES family NAD+ phosphorylase [Paenibacillus sp. FSL P4-0184]|uniref:RES family NAD+ phosphorylase n=1 Tax=Paenibacillus sp. FSL P4-0184 TaxID=2921632 RepID=UPI0030FC47C7